MPVSSPVAHPGFGVLAEGAIQSFQNFSGLKTAIKASLKNLPEKGGKPRLYDGASEVKFFFLFKNLLNPMAFPPAPVIACHIFIAIAKTL